MSNLVHVLDDTSYVELLDAMASDLKVVNAARVSYKKKSLEMTPRDVKLIDFLMREGHGSPFEHCVFQFEVKAPLFTVRQWQRHRIASYNEQSGRWTEFEPEFYSPDEKYRQWNEKSYQEYLDRLAAGEPKERARMVLGTGIYTSFWFTVNARSLMNFISLRSGETAQSAIQEYSKALEHHFRVMMPVTWAAFDRNNRKAP